ncbi:MAG: hypothetical protein ACJ0GV_03575 [Dehalococcoidia bacterium]|tara:strand:+ start:399 stop:809 length:411 start_codon:yes stop_codon:yes gene_type:complete
MTSLKEIRINKSTSLSKTSKSLIIKEEIEKKIFTSKILKKNISGYKFLKKSKSNNQLLWSIAGIITAVITWQISTTNYISIYGSIILVIISLFLYFDYVLQREKILITIFLYGNTIEFQTDDNEIDSIEEFLKKIN